MRTPFQPPRHVFACLVQHIAVGPQKTPIEGAWTYAGLAVHDTPEKAALGRTRALSHVQLVEKNATPSATASTRKIDTPEIRLAFFELDKMPAGLSAALLETAFNLLTHIDVDHLPWQQTGTTTQGHRLKQTITLLPDSNNIMMAYKGARTAVTIEAESKKNIGAATDLYALHTRLQQLESPLRYFMLMSEEGSILPIWRPYPPFPANKQQRPVAALPLVGTEQMSDQQCAGLLTEQFSALAALDKKTSCHILSPDGLPCLLAADLLIATPSPSKTAALLRA